MKIVILDGFTLNPGDLSWKEIEQFGEVEIYDRTPAEKVRARIQDAEIVLTNKTPVDRDTILNSPALKYIGVLATGYNIVDIDAANERKIIVSNVPAYGTHSVAQHTFALMLELASHVGLHANSVHHGDWSAQPDFSYWLKPMVELNGKTLGIVGLGKIGQAVARIALAFGMKVISYHTHPDRDRMEGVTFVDLETCFKDADVVSLHCPQTESNKGFVNEKLLKTMKPTSLLINVSRGALILEEDLAFALNNDIISGAGLDVLSKEPPLDNPLLQAKNCIVTPHVAWATQSARARLLKTVAENIKAYLKGKPQNVVGK